MQLLIQDLEKSELKKLIDEDLKKINSERLDEINENLIRNQAEMSREGLVSIDQTFIFHRPPKPSRKFRINLKFDQKSHLGDIYSQNYANPEHRSTLTSVPPTYDEDDENQNKPEEALKTSDYIDLLNKTFPMASQAKQSGKASDSVNKYNLKFSNRQENEKLKKNEELESKRNELIFKHALQKYRENVSKTHDDKKSKIESAEMKQIKAQYREIFHDDIENYEKRKKEEEVLSSITENEENRLRKFRDVSQETLARLRYIYSIDKIFEKLEQIRKNQERYKLSIFYI